MVSSARVWAGILLGLFLACAVLMTFVHPFDHDEFEHLHSAWNIRSGLRPYADFFEHHHPLLWALLVPVLGIFGETTAALFAARVMMLALVLVMGRLVFLLARRIFPEPPAPLFAIAILFSTVLFVSAGVQVRPDVPQSALLLWAVLEIVRHGEDGKPRRLIAAAFLVSLAFLFLQKTILFLPVAAAAGLWRSRGPVARRPSAGTAAVCLAAFLAPIAFFLLVLKSRGMLADYWTCGWLFNLSRGSVVPPLSLWLATLGENVGQYALGLAAVALSVRRERRRRITPLLPATIAVFGTVPFLLGSPYGQYFLLPIALMSVLVGGLLKDTLPLLVRRRTAAALLVLFLALPPSISFGARALIGNRDQLRLVDHVLRGTAPDDRVHDGRSEFNVFRKDLHYFWFMKIFHDRSARLPARLEARRADFEPLRLVTALRPAFATDEGLDPSSPGFKSLYAETEFRNPRYPVNLYRRFASAARGRSAD